MTEAIEQLREQAETEKEQLNQALKEATQKANSEIQDLELQVAAVKEENRMQEETCADAERKARSVQEENDNLQR